MKRTLPIRGFLGWLWLAAIVALLGLHAVHLRADFPNNSPWMDYSKYTDEGWYGKAAIEHYVLGSWYVHGDFNPSVALPVLPALELALFHFTGVSLVAARLLILGVFAANLMLAYLLVRTQASRWVGLFAVTLLAANAFLWAFSRLAILEPLLMLFLLGAWLAALQLPRIAIPAGHAAALVGIGVMVCLMVLTKTTAVFLLPSIFFLIWHAYGYRFRPALVPAITVLLSAAIPWGVYYLIFVHPHYVSDYHYLFAANDWERPKTLTGNLAAFWYALHGVLWISPMLCALAIALMVLAAVFFRGLWRNPLVIASLLAAGGYILFTGWHNNMQPRYYQIIVYPMVFFIALAVQAMFTADARPIAGRVAAFGRPAAFAAVAAAALISAWNLREIAGWARHPEYTWITAANQLTRYIDEHPNGNRLLLSISGDNITLITHLPAICDDFGTWDLPLRIHNYQPGWYAAWNEIDPGTLEDLHTQFTLEQTATFHAFDDPDRNQLVLYKLHPLPPSRLHYDQAIEEQANAGK